MVMLIVTPTSFITKFSYVMFHTCPAVKQGVKWVSERCAGAGIRRGTCG